MNIVNVTATPDGRLSRNDAARYLGVASKSLSNWMARGYGPPSLKVGGRRFYKVTDLEAFVAKSPTNIARTEAR